MNPRIADIASRTNAYMDSGFTFSDAVSQVARETDMSETTIDHCLVASLGIDTSTPDPFNTDVDDWQEDYWR